MSTSGNSDMKDSEQRSDLAELRELVRQFVLERNWDKFHTSKNLASALNVTAKL